MVFCPKLRGPSRPKTRRPPDRGTVEAMTGDARERRSLSQGSAQQLACAAVNRPRLLFRERYAVEQTRAIVPEIASVALGRIGNAISFHRGPHDAIKASSIDVVLDAE